MGYRDPRNIQVAGQAMGRPGIVVKGVRPKIEGQEVNVYGNLRNYKHDKGEGLHRRSLYTIWKRTAAPPEMPAWQPNDTRWWLVTVLRP